MTDLRGALSYKYLHSALVKRVPRVPGHLLSLSNGSQAPVLKCTKRPAKNQNVAPEQGVLRLIWSGRLECVFVDPKGAKISKNGNKITCRLSKNKHFLFYTQGRGGNIMPATPS